MSEDDSKPKEEAWFDTAPPRASRDEVVQFFRERKTRDECPICGTADWILPDEEERYSSYLPLGDDDGKIRIGGPHIPIVVVVCSNCGFLRQHAKMLIAAALRAAGRKEGGGDG